MSRSRLWGKEGLKLKPHNIKQPMYNRVIWQRLLRGLGFVQHKAVVDYSSTTALFIVGCLLFIFYFFSCRSCHNSFFYFFAIIYVKTAFILRGCCWLIVSYNPIFLCQTYGFKCLITKFLYIFCR
jgi:hypothetical protein